MSRQTIKPEGRIEVPQAWNLDTLIGDKQASVDTLRKAAGPHSRLTAYFVWHTLENLDQLLDAIKRDIGKIQGLTKATVLLESWQISSKEQQRDERRINTFIKKFASDKGGDFDFATYVTQGNDMYRRALELGLAKISKELSIPLEVRLIDCGSVAEIRKTREAISHADGLKNELTRLIQFSGAELAGFGIQESSYMPIVLRRLGQYIKACADMLNHGRNPRMRTQIRQHFENLKESEAIFVVCGAGHSPIISELVSKPEVSFEYQILSEAMLNILPPSYKFAFAVSGVWQAAVRRSEGQPIKPKERRAVAVEFLVSCALQNIVDRLPDKRSQSAQAFRAREVADTFAGFLTQVLLDPTTLTDAINEGVSEAFTKKSKQPILRVLVDKLRPRIEAGMDLPVKSPADFYLQLMKICFPK